jgi:magnesium transporter
MDSLLARSIFNADISQLTQFKEELNSLAPVDTGELIVHLPAERRALAFRLLEKNHATQVFEYLTPEVQQELIESLYDSQVLHLVESMSPDDRALLFDELPASVVQRLLAQLSPAARQDTATILGYLEGTAGRIMTTEYVRLTEGLTVEQATAKMKLQDRDKETIYYAYVTDENRMLVGVVSLRQLIFSLPDVLVRDIASTKIIKVATDTPQEDVARMMKRYDLIALPVVDKESRLVGLVTIDDIIDVVDEEATEDVQKIVGGSGDEQALCHPLVTIQKRLPWLLGNIFLYIGAASAVAPFQRTISMVPVIAVIMPILSNTSGNVAIQSLAVTVRGLGVGEITTADTLKLVQKELIAACGLALGLGAALGMLSLLWSSEGAIWLAAIAAAIMCLNVFIAATLGTLLPMLLKRYKLDPALISGPLLTTILDAIGFFSFLVCVSSLA